ncbi:MAG TPA: 4Fe-4S dicluster domain-containing protein [Chloroflexota bacterium]|nr:4Fe-4S dicluster domain-containing protein [Chloroflexota bacterium]
MSETPQGPDHGERRPYPTRRLSDGKARAIVFDAQTCIGCRQCVEACKDWNDLPRGDTYAINPSTWITMEPPVLEGTASTWGRNSCMHCEYPLCAAVCPVEAITKYDEGPVVIDPAVCIGCEYCVYACPWHVIAKSEVTGRATKCTMCVDRVRDDKQPFCVQACPVHALSFGIVDEMDARATERAAQVGGHVYGKSQAGGTHVLHVLTKSAAEHGLPDVGTERYPEHHIPLAKEIRGVLTLTGGLSGKMRAVTNAVTKPWRLKYRYWHKPE